MDYLSLIKLPIEAELADFIDLFNKSLMHSDGLLSQVLDHIRQRAGKRMRPILILLMARNFGKVSSVTQHSAVGLELLHTASLVHVGGDRLRFDVAGDSGVVGSLYRYGVYAESREQGVLCRYQVAGRDSVGAYRFGCR